MLELQGWYLLKVIQSNKNGTPDLICFKDGKAFFIECKSETGKLSELQKYRHQELKSKGFNVFTINQLTDVTKISTIL
jgi:Holliday junction resolvase